MIVMVGDYDADCATGRGSNCGASGSAETGNG
jgi:hypothetical protein